MCREEERRICGSGNGRRGDRMKVYTEKDLEGFERDDFGRLICPRGDYTQIKSFGNECSFGNGCSFGQWCSFGNGCSFGERCSFGKGCSFGQWCGFGEGCNFGQWCRFGEGCNFGERCSFGNECSFGQWCGFGEGCNFEGGRVSCGRYVAVDRIGSEKRKTYFFADRDGNIFVRAGCWFSDLPAFKERVRDVHAGTRHEKEYLAACDLAELMLMEEEKCS